MWHTTSLKGKDTIGGGGGRELSKNEWESTWENTLNLENSSIEIGKNAFKYENNIIKSVISLIHDLVIFTIQ